jgi:hypothetical protein
MKDQPIDAKQIEILAFNLSHDPAISAEAAQKLWQDNPELRAETRAQAERVLHQLHTLGGLRLRVCDSRAQASFLTWLMTVPPRPAYNTEELAALK